MTDRIKLTEKNVRLEGKKFASNLELKVRIILDWPYAGERRDNLTVKAEQLRQQIIDDDDIVSNLGVNPRQLIQEWKKKSEKWDKITDRDNPHDGICNVEVNRILEQENKQLKEESNNLKFRLADEQDEINRINGEWRKDIQIVDDLKKWQQHIEAESQNPLQEKNHSFQPSAINYNLKKILGDKQ